MRSRRGGRSGSVVSFIAAGLLLGGCAGVTATVAPTASVAERPLDIVERQADFDEPMGPALARADGAIADVDTVDESGADELVVAQADRADRSEPPGDMEDEYDPWEPFNETMFNFNYKADRYVLKPVARGYKFVMPEQFQIMIDNGFHNIKVVPRFVNNLLQGKFDGAVRELTRFVVNSTLGVGGLFDAAKSAGIERSNEDFGQTLGVWGFPAGPYLVLPLMEPMTVRDGIGRGVDGFLDPLSYVLPFFWDRLGMKIGETINDRALNYDLFQGVEDTTLDLYSSVRHFYLKRREQQIKE